MYNKEYEPFLTTGQQLPEYRKQCEKIEQKLCKLIDNGIDQSLADALKKMLLEEPSKRPSPQLFTLIKFFNDRAVLCLRQLEDVEFMDPTTAVHYYSFQLKDALKVIPEELWFRRILPRLEVDLSIHQELTSVIIRPILYMLQNCSTNNVSNIERVFDNLFEDMQNQHKQVLITLLDNADILAGRCVNFVNKIFNLLMSALQHSCKNVRVGNVAVCSIMKISRSFDADRIRNDLVPQLLMLLSVQDQPDHIQCHVIKTLCILLSAINDRGIGQVLDELCRLLRKTSDQNIRIIIITIQLMVQFLSNEKLTTPEQSSMLGVRRDSISGNVMDGHLQVPHQRMQRRSLGNLFSDISLQSPCTTTASSSTTSTGRFLSVSERNVDQASKMSMGPPTRSMSQHHNQQRPSSPNLEYLSSLFSTCFNSQPSSPVLTSSSMAQRRHSMQVTNESGQQQQMMRKTSRPSSFTNLSHNIYIWRTFLSYSTLPREADIVIIGGGVIGCSTLYHLTKFGAKNCVLIEKSKIGSGTTWHSAALLWRLRKLSDVDIQLLDYMRLLNKEILPQEYGQDVGWLENGGLFIASNTDRLKEYKRLNALGRFFGVESQILTLHDVRSLYPLLNDKDILGALYSPGDGIIDQNAYCRAMVTQAKKNGAQVIEDCAAVKINSQGSNVTSIDTTIGAIKTQAIVNCAGVWSTKVARMVNLSIPLMAIKHSYIISQSIDGVSNMPNVRDHDSSIYLKTQGQCVVAGGYEPNPDFCDPVADDFSYSLYNFNWDTFASNMKNIINRLPILKNTPVKSEICGPESFTVDHEPLLGPSSQIHNFYFGCGFNSAGIMLSGGCGRELAHWILNNRPTLPMHDYDIARFSSRSIENRTWVKERCHEAYATNYDIVYPNTHSLAGRPLIKSMLYGKLLQKGCFFEEIAGRERPAWFSRDGSCQGIRPYDYLGFYGHEKHKDYSYRDTVRMGHTFDYPQYQNLINEEFWAAIKNCIIVDNSGIGVFYLSGSNAKKLIQWLICSDVRGDPGSTFYSLMLNQNGGVEFDVHITIIDRDFLNVKGLAKYPSYILTCDVRAVEAFERYVKSRLIDNVDFVNVTDQISVLILQAVDAGHWALEALNLENGGLLWNVDMNPEDTPLELGMGHLCDEWSLDFRGKFALEDQKKSGVEKKLIRLSIDGRGGYSPVSKRSIGQGFVKNGNLQLPYLRNSKFQVEVTGERIDATLL
uniref:Uncharacterized protein n=1 Tax=Romanomermis culicivorax TaxID=13658 RepID=A0A915KXL9_ROMCU